MNFALGSSDKHLLTALSQGSEAAFEALFGRYYQGLRRYAGTLVRFPTDAAEDVVAEVFCTLWDARTRLAVTGSVAAYLYTAVKHRALDRLREQRRTPLETTDELLPDYAAAECQQPDQLLAFAELSQQVQHLIEQLPERTRLVYQLQREGGLTYEEIATLLGISVNSVKTHMFRGLRFLKDALYVSGTR
jgi:RNA polymerase sigma-70 factor (family 1)